MTLYTRRDVSRLLALTGAAGLFPGAARRGRAVAPDDYELSGAPLARTPAEPDERFWSDVRAKFLVPRDLNFLNAANLCPA